MTNSNKKLQLNKEVIAQLNDDGMSRVLGGDINTAGCSLKACNTNITCLRTCVGATCQGGGGDCITDGPCYTTMAETQCHTGCNNTGSITCVAPSHTIDD